MKKFFKDMWDLQKHSNQFMKEHWKGYIVFTAAVYGAVYVPLYIKAKHDEKKHNDEIRKMIDEIEALNFQE